MQALQNQINTLSSKIDSLYEVVERISLKLTESVNQPLTCTDESVQSSASASPHAAYASSHMDPSLIHKDVLEDHTYLDGSRSDQALSPELQIQRLTAQLTAAYNRIAALEEQLLATRAHH